MVAGIDDQRISVKEHYAQTESNASTVAEQTEASWVEKTQTLQNQIIQAREGVDRIRRSVDCLLVLSPPTEGRLNEVKQETPMVAERRSVDETPLMLRLDDLRRLMDGLNCQLEKLSDRIRV